MNILNAFILGFAQGLTEFLPVSSSGHLLLLEKLGIGEPSLLFNVLLHLGSLLAVLIIFRKPLWQLLRHPFQKKTLYLLLASIPTGAIAQVFKYAFPALLSGSYLALGFMTTACLLTATKVFENSNQKMLDGKILTICGISQGIAVLPGISRSGATISTLMLLGVPKEDAFEFSFLLSIPIILASAVLESVEFFTIPQNISYSPVAIVVGVLTAFISGFVALKLFASIIRKHSLMPFAIYTAILSIVTLVLYLV